MKKIIGLLCAIASIACAADVKLTDGRVLTGYQVTAQTATTVTIKHSSGIVKVAKTLLPPDVREKYPIDEKAAAAEAAEIARGKEAYEAQAKANAALEEQARLARKAESDKKRERLERIADEVAKGRDRGEVERQLAAEESAALLPEKIKDAVAARSDRYFKSEHKMPSSALTLDLKTEIRDPRAVPGWPGRYEVTGVAWWQDVSSQRGFNAAREWFLATVEVKNGKPQVTTFEKISEPTP